MREIIYIICIDIFQLISPTFTNKNQSNIYRQNERCTCTGDDDQKQVGEQVGDQVKERDGGGLCGI